MLIDLVEQSKSSDEIHPEDRCFLITPLDVGICGTKAVTCTVREPYKGDRQVRRLRIDDLQVCDIRLESEAMVHTCFQDVIECRIDAEGTGDEEETFCSCG